MKILYDSDIEQERTDSGTDIPDTVDSTGT